MQKSRLAMRRAVLGKMFDHLQEYYGVDWSKDTFTDGRLSLHQIDALLAFKSDSRLDELRSALGRIEDGSYGICIGCRHEIEQQMLDVDPARLLCSVCEKEYMGIITDSYESRDDY